MDKVKLLWPFKYSDRTTWKYSDCIMGGCDNNRYIKNWILNPKFAYRHLDPHYPKDKS